MPWDADDKVKYGDFGVNLTTEDTEEESTNYTNRRFECHAFCVSSVRCLFKSVERGIAVSADNFFLSGVDY